MEKKEQRKQVHPFVKHPKHDRCAICDRPRTDHSLFYDPPPIDERPLSGAQ